MFTSNDYIAAVQNLNVYRRGESRAPHQPLLLLMAIAKLLRGEYEVPFKEVEEVLNPLLKIHAPPVVGRHQPELPYWHLMEQDPIKINLWKVEGAADLPQQKGNFPRMAGLRKTFGRLDSGFAEKFLESKTFLRTVVNVILEDHFSDTLHFDLLSAFGLHLPLVDHVADSLEYKVTKRPRDPKFRDNILRAYEHKCAVTGFQAALQGLYFGCEAAHIQMHSKEGPDVVANGFAVEPTLHKLFDVGAWSLTDDCRIIVSREFTGSSETTDRIRSLHGKPLRSPIAGEPQPSVEYIRWHREAGLGGIFKGPGLPL